MAELFCLADAETGRIRNGRAYFEFLRKAALSAGIYVLPAGAEDSQSPHAEDEIYYVLAGRAQFRAGSHDHAVVAGDLLYVPAHEPHRFHAIDEDLRLLVFFAPAESSP